MLEVNSDTPELRIEIEELHKIMLEAGNKASRRSYFSTLVLT